MAFNLARQQRRREEIAESLRAMKKENEAKALLRERERLREAQEDARLMREYEEKLDRWGRPRRIDPLEPWD